MVERTRLENERPARDRGFESLTLRHEFTQIKMYRRNVNFKEVKSVNDIERIVKRLNLDSSLLDPLKKALY